MRFLKIPYSEIQGKSLKLSIKNIANNEQYFIILKAYPDDVESAISYANVNPWVTAIQYIGVPEDLVMLQEKAVNVHIYCIKDMSQLMGTQIPNVPIVVNAPAEYSNMREMLNICTSFPNVSFIGGDFLKIKGVRLGEIPDDKLPRANFAKKSRILYSGYDCSALPIDCFDAVKDTLEYGEEICKYAAKESKLKTKAPVEPKQPKQKAAKVTAEKVLKAKEAKPKAEKKVKPKGSILVSSSGLDSF
jgi:hypothetical protein